MSTTWIISLMVSCSLAFVFKGNLLFSSFLSYFLESGSIMNSPYPNASVSEHLVQKPFRNTNPNNVSTKLRDASSPQQQQQHLHSRLVEQLLFRLKLLHFFFINISQSNTIRSVQQEAKHQPHIGRNISAMLNENNTVVCYLEPLSNS